MASSIRRRRRPWAAPRLPLDERVRRDSESIIRREFDLVKRGLKPVAMLGDWLGHEAAVRREVAAGRIVHIAFETPIDGGPPLVEHFLAMPGQEWRVALLRRIQSSLMWVPHAERHEPVRRMSRLLGYPRRMIVPFIARERRMFVEAAARPSATAAGDVATTMRDGRPPFDQTKDIVRTVALMQGLVDARVPEPEIRRLLGWL